MDVLLIILILVLGIMFFLPLSMFFIDDIRKLLFNLKRRKENRIKDIIRAKLMLNSRNLKEVKDFMNTMLAYEREFRLPKFLVDRLIEHIAELETENYINNNK